MKITEKKSTLEKIERYTELNEMMKVMTKELGEIKTDLKNIMIESNTNSLNAGNYICVVTTRTRTEVDKEKVKIMLGTKFESCLKHSLYQIFEVKKA